MQRFSQFIATCRRNPIKTLIGVLFLLVMVQAIVGPPPETPTPPAVAAATEVEKQPDVTYSVISEDKIPGVKYAVNYRLDAPAGTLPTIEQLERISANVEKAKPGFQRYFVLFYLPGMVVDEGAFATAHRPEDSVKVNWFMAPDNRQDEVRAFYGIK